MNLLYKKANVSTMDALGELWGKGQEKAYGAWQTAGDELSSLGGKAKEKAGDVAHTAKSPVRTMLNMESASKNLDAASKNVELGTGDVASNIGKATDNVRKASEDISDGVHDAVNSARNKSKDVKNKVGKGKKALMIGGGLAGGAALTGLGVLGYKHLKDKQQGEQQEAVSGKPEDGNRPVPRRIGADGVPAKMAPITERQKPRIPISRVSK